MFANNYIKLDLREADVSSGEYFCRHKNVSFLCFTVFSNVVFTTFTYTITFEMWMKANVFILWNETQSNLYAYIKLIRQRT